METSDATKEEVDHDWGVCNGFFVSSLVRNALRSPYRIALKPTSVHNEMSLTNHPLQLYRLSKR